MHIEYIFIYLEHDYSKLSLSSIQICLAEVINSGFIRRREKLVH